MVQTKNVAELAAEVEALKGALRWSLGFIVNVTVGLELVVGANANTVQIRQGIKEALKRMDVPKGVLSNLRDTERLLKEWDYRTFRGEQKVEEVEWAADHVVFRHRDCPAPFQTMRRVAPFLIGQVDMQHYRSVATTKAACDFLCVPHTLCRSVLVDWLSNGKYVVEEIDCRLDQPGRGVCSYAVHPRARNHDHQ